MMDRINVDAQWAAFWAGFDGRITKMGGDPEKEWVKKRLGKLFSYDPGQILDIFLESETGLRDINIFEFPGGEVCSSFIASCFDCGNHAINRPGLADFEGLPHIHETADIAPGHFSQAGFEAIKPDDHIYAGYVMMHMSWGDPGADVKQKLLTLIAELIAFGASLGAVRHAYIQSRDLFKDGIKQVSRDYFKIPYPYWQATHVSLIWRDPEGDMLTCVGQEVYLKQFHLSELELREKMSGDTPEIIVSKPVFLYR